MCLNLGICPARPATTRTVTVSNNTGLIKIQTIWRSSFLCLFLQQPAIQLLANPTDLADTGRSLQGLGGHGQLKVNPGSCIWTEVIHLSSTGLPRYRHRRFGSDQIYHDRAQSFACRLIVLFRTDRYRKRKPTCLLTISAVTDVLLARQSGDSLVMARLELMQHQVSLRQRT